MSLFRDNRERLISRLRAKNEISIPGTFVVLQGGVEIPFNDTDIKWPFRQVRTNSTYVIILYLLMVINGNVIDSSILKCQHAQDPNFSGEAHESFFLNFKKTVQFWIFAFKCDFRNSAILPEIIFFIKNFVRKNNLSLDFILSFLGHKIRANQRRRNRFFLP